jgi:ABC-type dipeptide/oligopeptide/nickel transport system ATPase component
MLEVRFLLDRINIGDDVKVISDEVWENAKRELRKTFQQSSKLEICNNLIKQFEDSYSQKKYKSDLDVFVKEGGTVLMVTHTLFVAQELATRIGIFEKGKLKIEGTYKELVDKAHLPTKTSLDDVYKNYLAK